MQNSDAMKRALVGMAIAALAAVAMLAYPAREAGAAEGVYTAEQARRGRAIYDNKCASCHEGGSMGPELSGDGFRTNWQSKTAGAFYSRVVESMPADDPGTLSPTETFAIVAYVLQMNGLPAGSTAIASLSELNAVQFSREP
jgi:mono/diheme cytochrome c family protein